MKDLPDQYTQNFCCTSEGTLKNTIHLMHHIYGVLNMSLTFCAIPTSLCKGSAKTVEIDYNFILKPKPSLLKGMVLSLVKNLNCFTK